MTAPRPAPVSIVIDVDDTPAPPFTPAGAVLFAAALASLLLAVEFLDHGVHTWRRLKRLPAELRRSTTAERLTAGLLLAALLASCITA